MGALRSHLLLLMVFILTASRAASYTRITSASGDSPKWASMPVPIWVSAAGCPQIANGSDFNAVQAALQTWESVASADIQFDYRGTSPQHEVGADGMNLITFTDDTTPLGSSTIAATFSFYTIQNNAVLFAETDVTFNSAIAFSTSDEPGKYDIQSLLTHELGHVLGLDHAALMSSVMVPFSQAGQVDQRTLSYDDIAGVSEIYPKASGTPPVGQIEGFVLQGVLGAFGAHLVAVDQRGTAVVSTLAQPTGLYLIRFVPPGVYSVYAEPLDLPITEQNFGGWYRNLPTDFGTTYAPQSVQVAAGPATSLTNIQVLPSGTTGLNLTRPAFAPRISRGTDGTFTLGGASLTPGISFTNSSPDVTLGAPTYGGQISLVAATSASMNLAIAGSAALGPKNITATLGADTSVLSGAFVVVNPQPTPVSMTPTSGPMDGGTAVMISGSNFRPGASVYFGGLAATSVSVIDSTSISAVTPSNVPGITNVVIVNADGTNGLLSGALDYILPNPVGVPPSRPVVTDGGARTSSQTELFASWTSQDPVYGIREYQYAIGSSAAASDVQAFTLTTSNSADVTGLNLTVGATYFFVVRAVNNAGLVSDVGVSDGIVVDPTFQPDVKIIPSSPQSASTFSGIALYAPAAMSVVLKAMDANGNLITGAGVFNPTTVSLAAGQQSARLVQELFGLAAFDGWIQVEASTTGLGVYVATGSWDMSSMNGSVPRETSADFVLFHPGSTAILVNPSMQTASVTVTDVGGVNSQTSTIPARSKVSTTISAISRIQSSVALAALESIGSFGSAIMLGIASPAPVSSAQASIVIPDGVTGGGYSTTLSLVNVASTPVDATVSFAGASKTLSLASNTTAQVSLADFLQISTSAVQSGAVRVDASMAILGVVDIENASSLVSLGVLPAATDVVFPQVANGNGLFTGLCIATGGQAATITIDVYPASGGTPKSATLTVGANQQIARLLSELVPAVTAQLGGYILIHSDQPIWSWEIYGSDQIMASGPPG